MENAENVTSVTEIVDIDIHHHSGSYWSTLTLYVEQQPSTSVCWR